jgi:hypothetical protein
MPLVQRVAGSILKRLNHKRDVPCIIHEFNYLPCGQLIFFEVLLIMEKDLG